MKTVTKKFRVMRDGYGDYCISYSKLRYDPPHVMGNVLSEFCEGEWKRATGIKLKAGEEATVEMTFKRILE